MSFVSCGVSIVKHPSRLDDVLKVFECFTDKVIGDIALKHCCFMSREVFVIAQTQLRHLLKGQYDKPKLTDREQAKSRILSDMREDPLLDVIHDRLLLIRQSLLMVFSFCLQSHCKVMSSFSITYVDTLYFTLLGSNSVSKRYPF
jgi:hypothetical protein